MLIKLNFTENKRLNTVFRIIDQAINNTDITSISTLQSVATNGTWWSGLLSGLDATNSFISRTGTGNTALTTAKTVSRYSKSSNPSSSYLNDHYWTVEFSSYDNSSQKYYVQYNQATNSTASSYGVIGTTVSPSMTSSASMAPTQNDNTTSAPGTVRSVSGTTTTSTVASSSGGFANVRSMWVYITDTCLIWSATSVATYNVGFGPTYNSESYYTGPYIFSQYTRQDYHNTSSNGIYPLMYTNFNRATGAGFGGSTIDWTTAENTNYISAETPTAFKVLNLINAYPNTTASYPIVTFPKVNWGSGSRFSDIAGLTANAAGATSAYNGSSYNSIINNTVGVRYPSADLTSVGYAMLPCAWRNTYYYNAGGDASSQGGWYVFNGDYFPGDEFTYGGKTYVIFPTFSGYSARVGIAVPKE